MAVGKGCPMSKKVPHESNTEKVAAPLRQLTHAREKSIAHTDQARDARTLALDIGRMLETARTRVARTANAALTTLYWQSAPASARTS